MIEIHEYLNIINSEGLLTKKGYEFKTSLLVLEKELEEGMELVKITFFRLI